MNTDTIAKPSARKSHPMAFLMADFIYLLLVFSWTLWIPPVGKDYALLENPAQSGFSLGEALIRLEIRLFGDNPVGYHLTNLFLLYLCVALVFLLTRLAGRGPWWLGSIAGVLFLAHPLKAAAVLQSTGGAIHLLPAALVLAVLCAYGLARTRPGILPLLAAALCAGVGAYLGPEGQSAALAILAWEGIVTPRSERHWGKALLCAGISLAGWGVQGYFYGLISGNILHRLFSWQFIYYPFGITPENAAGLEKYPLLMMGILSFSLLIAALVFWKTPHPAVRWGLLASFLLIPFTAGSVDPVHLLNGASLTVPCALAAIAVAGLCHAVIRHPRWPQSVVWLSTLLCVIFMIFHAHENWIWIRSGHLITAFQKEAAALAPLRPEEEIAVLPDIRVIGHVPIDLSASLRHRTAFGNPLPIQSIGYLDLYTPDLSGITVDSYDTRKAQLRLSGNPTPKCWSAVHMHTENPEKNPWSLWMLAFPDRRKGRELTTEITLSPYAGEFPERRIPFPKEK